MSLKLTIELPLDVVAAIQAAASSEAARSQADVAVSSIDAVMDAVRQLPCVVHMRSDYQMSADALTPQPLTGPQRHCDLRPSQRGGKRDSNEAYDMSTTESSRSTIYTPEPSEKDVPTAPKVKTRTTTKKDRGHLATDADAPKPTHDFSIRFTGMCRTHNKFFTKKMHVRNSTTIAQLKAEIWPEDMDTAHNFGSVYYDHRSLDDSQTIAEARILPGGNVSHFIDVPDRVGKTVTCPTDKMSRSKYIEGNYPIQVVYPDNRSRTFEVNSTSTVEALMDSIGPVRPDHPSVKGGSLFLGSTVLENGHLLSSYGVGRDSFVFLQGKDSVWQMAQRS